MEEWVTVEMPQQELNQVLVFKWIPTKATIMEILGTITSPSTVMERSTTTLGMR